MKNFINLERLRKQASNVLHALVNGIGMFFQLLISSRCLLRYSIGSKVSSDDIKVRICEKSIKAAKLSSMRSESSESDEF